MAFKAASAVESLDFDLSPFVDAKGTIPEPSHDLRDKFLARVETLTASETDEVSVEQLRTQEKEMVAAVAELCQGTPSAAQLGKMPPRPLYAFLVWIVDQLSADPTQGNTSG